MNIFILDDWAVKSVTYHSDIHVNKMLIEACQILCTVHHLAGTDASIIPYRKTHIHHPCVKWVMQSIKNYNWLCMFASKLAIEYQYRKSKANASGKIVNWCDQNSPDLPVTEVKTPHVIGFNQTKYADCIIKVDTEIDVVASYREYYRKYKQGYWRKSRSKKDGTVNPPVFVPHTWTLRGKPDFMIS